MLPLKRHLQYQPNKRLSSGPVASAKASSSPSSSVSPSETSSSSTWTKEKNNALLVVFKWSSLILRSTQLPPAKEVCEGYVLTGVCLSTRGGLCPGGSLSRGSLSRGWGVSVHGGGGVLSGRSLSRRSPHYDNMRAVSILLECILVFIEFFWPRERHWTWQERKRNLETLKIKQVCILMWKLGLNCFCKIFRLSAV